MWKDILWKKADKNFFHTACVKVLNFRHSPVDKKALCQ